MVLSPTWRDIADAARGPLKPGEVGVVVNIDSSSVPLKVQAPCGRSWWYKTAALQLESGKAASLLLQAPVGEHDWRAAPRCMPRLSPCLPAVGRNPPPAPYG